MRSLVTCIVLGIIVGSMLGGLAAVVASIWYYNVGPEVKSVNVDSGAIYVVPEGYILWRVDGKVCHVVGILKGDIEGTVDSVLTQLRFISFRNQTIVCDYTVSSHDIPLSVPHKGGKYYALTSSVIYVAYDRPKNDDWVAKGTILGSVIGGIIPIITAVLWRKIKK